MNRAVLVAGIAGIAAMLAGCGSTAETDSASAPDTRAAADANTMAKLGPPEFAYCRTCHAVQPGERGAGPSLFGIFGKKAASVPGFSYSPALKSAQITWDRASLDLWLQGPPQMVPGTRMIMGVPDPAQRKAIVDYLETLK